MYRPLCGNKLKLGEAGVVCDACRARSCLRCGSPINRPALQRELEAIDIGETSLRAATRARYCRYACMLADLSDAWERLSEPPAQ